MPALDGTWTVEMLDALPDDGQRHEIIDGVRHVTPAPSDVHQLVVGQLWRRLDDYLRRSSVGRAIVAPADVRCGDRGRNRVQPDVFVVRLTDGKRPSYPYDLSNLLLAVEVTAPGNPLDYQVKRELYLTGGVPEYWIANADSRMVSRWRSLEDPGEEFGRALVWHPPGMSAPLRVDLPQLFEDALA